MNNLDSALVEMAELLATWRREIAEAGPLNKRDLRPSRFADDLDTLRTRLAGNAHGIANHGDERASKETLVQCDCGCGRSCCACCGTDLGFIAEQPATPAGGGDDSASYWVAEREGIIEFGMSTDDANDGGASREEVNDWINDQHAPGTYRLRRLASTGSAPATSSWRPIESAPMDGTWILLRGRSAVEQSMIPVVAAFSPVGSGCVGWFDSGSFRHVESLAVEWQPLPAAPTPEPKDG